MSDQHHPATAEPLGWMSCCPLPAGGPYARPLLAGFFPAAPWQVGVWLVGVWLVGVWLVGVWLATGFLFPQPMMAAESAARLARNGMRQYAQADYKGAENAFSEALAAGEDNPRQAFNLGCAVAAQGRLDEALPWFERAAMAEDSRLAARAQFNIGGVLVAEARKRLEPFGEQPESMPPDQRPPIVESLRRAIDAYQISRRLTQPNEEAAENVERLRLWLDQMQAAWKQFDRQQRRRQLDVLAFLQAIEEEQSALHEQVRASVGEWPSPRRRQVAYEAAIQQLETAGELGHLEEKFRELLASQPGGATADPATPNPLDRNPTTPDPLGDGPLGDGVASWIADRINTCRDHMRQAARHLEGDQWQPASESQTAADEALNDLYMAVVPFEQLLARSIERQQELLEASGRIAGQSGQPVPTATRHAELTPDDLARRQQRVTSWSEALLQKAQAILRQSPPSETRADEAPQDDAANDELGGPPLASDSGRQVACEKAVRLCPEIGRLSLAASKKLRTNRPDAAVPDQERALELLREIAETLPPPPQDQQNQDQQQDQQQQDQQQQDQQQQDQQQQDQQQQDQQQQDQQKQDQQKQDQQKQGQQKQDQQKQDQQKQDQQQQDQQQQDQQQQDQQKQDQQQQDQQQQDQQQQDQQQQGVSEGDAKQTGQRDAAERQAGAVLQRARQRQRQYAELQRQLQRFLREKSRGDRDW